MSAIAFWPGLAAGEELWLWPTFRTGSQQQQQQQHVALAAAAATNGASMLQFQKPQTCHAANAAVYVCVCSGRKSENNCMKTRDGSLKEARTANAASSDERQTKRGRQQSAHTHTHTHSWTPHVASWTSSIGKRLVGLDQSRVRRALGSPANRIIPFVCTLMVQLRHLCCQDKVQLTQA